MRDHPKLSCSCDYCIREQIRYLSEHLKYQAEYLKELADTKTEQSLQCTQKHKSMTADNARNNLGPQWSISVLERYDEF
jgi:hypothetical protein